MAAASLTKQVHRLMKTVGRRTDGQASVLGFESDTEYGDCEILQVAIEPNAGLYKGGRFTFSINIPCEFPHTDDTPAVWCESEVYHPNIDTTDTRSCSLATNVCLNILQYGVYNNNFGLEAVVQGLLFLMHNPNFADPLTPYFDGDLEAGIENVGRYMAGEEIDGQVFALERAEKYKDKKDGDVPGITDSTDAKDKIVDESPELIVNRDNKDETNVATEDESVENGQNYQRDTEGVTNANRVDSDVAAPIGAASSESTLVSEDAGEPTTVNTEHGSTAKEADNDNDDENDDEDDVYTGGYKLVELDGELVMMPAEDTDLIDELTTVQTADDNTDNQTNDIAENVESAIDAKEVTDVTPAISTEAQEHQETNNAQPKDTTDVANDADRDNEATAFVQEDIKPPRLDLSMPIFEKVFRKLVTNVQYIGGRVMGCLKRR